MKLLTPAFFLINLALITSLNAQQQKPNIIFILSDDIGYQTFSFNHGAAFHTPNLDSMVKNGMNFTSCHASPLCSPSRMTLLTGKYNFRNYFKWGVMDTTQITIANVLKNAGYATACFGKWQLDGGDISIHKFGFDSYTVWMPFAGSEPSRYKSPILYTNGATVSASLTENLYSEDIMTDSVISFMQRNKSRPFFIYYPMLLAHPPFQPTPDDNAYKTWTSGSLSDTSFYTSNIEYMDKKIGEIVNKVKSLGIANRTVIIYAGDNGTPQGINLRIGDSLIAGGKSLSIEKGLRVPLIIDWMGTVKPMSVNYDLISFVDFLPTLTHLGGASLPLNSGTFDGVDFYARLLGNAGNPRSWLFYDYDPHPGHNARKRWAETKQYKLYDTSSQNTATLFYNIINDPNELTPLPQNSLTPGEALIKQQLSAVIGNYVKQGVALLSRSDLYKISDSSVVFEDSIRVNGGSTITANGAAWSENPSPTYPASPHTSQRTYIGFFQSNIYGLKANTNYFVRAYAVNSAGITYGNEIKFRTLLNTPKALNATAISNNSFVAHWRSVPAASQYKLYVSTKPDFITIKPQTANVGFDAGLAPPTGWTFAGNIAVNYTAHGAGNPCLQFNVGDPQVITKQFSGPATQLKFWLKGLNTNDISRFIVEGFDGHQWVTIKTIRSISNTGVTEVFDSTSSTHLPANLIQFRFTYVKGSGTGSAAFDDVYIAYKAISNSFVTGYAGLNVSDTSFLVKNLNEDVYYYYRVKAVNSYNTSANSNTGSVETCNLCSDAIVASNIDRIIIFPNPSRKNFTLINNADSIDVYVTNETGHVVYSINAFNGRRLSFGELFSAGVYFVQIKEKNLNKRFKLIKTE